VFGTFAHRPDGGRAATPADVAMGAMIRARWVSFAKFGRPSCAGADVWPAYARESDSWMVFDDRGAHVVHGLPAAHLDLHESRVRWLLWLGRINAQLQRLF
jgi:carboxylesterase type B